MHFHCVRPCLLFRCFPESADGRVPPAPALRWNLRGDVNYAARFAREKVIAAYRCLASLADLSKHFMHVFACQLAFSFCGFLGFVNSSAVSMVVPVALPCLAVVPRRTRQQLSQFRNTVLRHCVQYALRLFAVFWLLFLSPAHHHLVDDWELLQHVSTSLAIIALALALARLRIPFASSSACSVIALATRLFSGFSALRAFSSS